MDIKEFERSLAEKMKEVQNFIEGEDIKDILGVQAKNHFKESFENEGFKDDETIQKWPEVKRRDPDSAWYGHSGQTGKFSESRTIAKILTGHSGELKESISYVKIDKGVRVSSPKEYAKVHQEGLQAKIYGKKVFQMPARPFIGNSKLLKRNIEAKILREIKKLLK